MSYRCENCGEIYTDIYNKWCNPCQLVNLKQDFTNWTSENEKIDNFIQEMQLKIRSYDDIVVEWIPYNQFNHIKKIIESDSFTLYSAIWMNGPLKYEEKMQKYKRLLNEKVTLKYLDISQENINEFLDKA
ncbi:unnamed protein product [Rhizophagus irregularis]|nr:unnamed protein product [Rhizophagus irregularis]